MKNTIKKLQGSYCGTKADVGAAGPECAIVARFVSVKLKE